VFIFEKCVRNTDVLNVMNYASQNLTGDRYKLDTVQTELEAMPLDGAPQYGNQHRIAKGNARDISTLLPRTAELYSNGCTSK